MKNLDIRTKKWNSPHAVIRLWVTSFLCRYLRMSFILRWKCDQFIQSVAKIENYLECWIPKMQPLSAFKMAIQEFSQNIAVVRFPVDNVEPKTSLNPWTWIWYQIADVGQQISRIQWGIKSEYNTIRLSQYKEERVNHDEWFDDIHFLSQWGIFNLFCPHLTYSLTGASCVCARNVLSSHARLLLGRWTQSKLRCHCFNAPSHCWHIVRYRARHNWSPGPRVPHI